MDDASAKIHFLASRNLGPARPTKAMPSHVTRDMRPGDAFRATLADCLAQIAANAATVRSGHSVEGLHQLRVAFRRLEVALGAFGREFKQDWLEELRGRAKILSGRLAPARDLDVFMARRLGGPGTKGEGFAQLRARAEDARETAWAAATACVRAAEFLRFTDDLAALAHSQLPLTRQRRLPRMAARILDRQMKRVKKRGRAARSKDEGDLHRLRIALKKLRYTAEFFAPLYPSGVVKRYLRAVKALQEHMGELNDIANVRGVIGALLQQQPRNVRKEDEAVLRFAAGTLVGRYGAQTPHAIRQALKRYADFREVTPFWR
jgi:CHAD domain-containing protein